MQPLKIIELKSLAAGSIYKLPKNCFVEWMELDLTDVLTAATAAYVNVLLYESFGKADINASTDYPILGSVYLQMDATENKSNTFAKWFSNVHKFLEEGQVYIQSLSAGFKYNVRVALSLAKTSTFKDRSSL